MPSAKAQVSSASTISGRELPGERRREMPGGDEHRHGDGPRLRQHHREREQRQREVRRRVPDRRTPEMLGGVLQGRDGRDRAGRRILREPPGEILLASPGGRVLEVERRDPRLELRDLAQHRRPLERHQRRPGLGAAPGRAGRRGSVPGRGADLAIGDVDAQGQAGAGDRQLHQIARQPDAQVVSPAACGRGWRPAPAASRPPTPCGPAAAAARGDAAAADRRRPRTSAAAGQAAGDGVIEWIPCSRHVHGAAVPIAGRRSDGKHPGNRPPVPGRDGSGAGAPGSRMSSPLPPRHSAGVRAAGCPHRVESR